MGYTDQHHRLTHKAQKVVLRGWRVAVRSSLGPRPCAPPTESSSSPRTGPSTAGSVAFASRHILDPIDFIDHLFLRKGQRHPFLPSEIPSGIGGVVLARVFRLVGRIVAEVGHDLCPKQLHRPHDLVVRNLANVEGTVQVRDTGILPFVQIWS